ncbi:MAG: hypothetical protein QG608_2189 [Actinomycetota bacterium]|nr:hypothetical protein [Actinomycetota bacterium]
MNHRNARPWHRRRSSWAALSVAALLAGGTTVFVVAGPASAEGTSSASSTHVDVYWKTDGPGNNLTNIDQVMSVEKKAQSSYWSMNFWYADAPDGGYIGLQTDATRPDGSAGEMAIFSMWNADKSRNRTGTCVVFGGEGDGLSCRAPYTIKLSNNYQYSVKRLEADSTGQWWGGWIRDMEAGTDTYLGDMHSTSKALKGPVINFSEYFGAPVPCSKVPTTKVIWTQPAANPSTSTPETPSSHEYHSTYDTTVVGDCTKASINPVDLGWTKGVTAVAGRSSS